MRVTLVVVLPWRLFDTLVMTVCETPNDLRSPSTAFICAVVSVEALAGETTAMARRRPTTRLIIFLNI